MTGQQPEKGKDPALSLAAVAARAFAYALNDLPGEVYAEIRRLRREDLARVAKAASLLRQAAQAELDARPEVTPLLVQVADGSPDGNVYVIAPTLRRFGDWCRRHGIRPQSPRVTFVRGLDGLTALEGTGGAWYAFLGIPAGLGYDEHQAFSRRLRALQENPWFRNAEG
jgi:hypothetical protein